jgi:hypothetical protein
MFLQGMSQKAKKLVGDVRFQLKMTKGDGVVEAIERHKEAEESGEVSRHFMLSYCWAQQSLVQRIRNSLGDRGYHVWLDIEQMQVRTLLYSTLLW